MFEPKYDPINLQLLMITFQEGIVTIAYCVRKILCVLVYREKPLFLGKMGTLDPILEPCIAVTPGIFMNVQTKLFCHYFTYSNNLFFSKYHC